MKTAKRFVFALLFIAVISIMFAFNVNASAEIIKSGECGELGDNLLWTLDSDGRLEISGSGGMDSYGYYSDRAPWGLNNTDVTEIIINEGVSSIGSYAFYAFTSVSKISIPESVSKIGKYAFFDCENLTELRFDAVNVNDFSNSNFIFAYCGIAGDGVSVIFGDNVTVIPEYMFCTSDYFEYKPFNIAAVIFGDALTEIGNYAFLYCDKISHIEIPSKVENIGEYSFFGCTALAEINVNDENPYYASVDGVLFNKNKQILIKYPSSRDEEEYNVPADTIRIKSGAFYDSKNLKKLVIGDNVAAIEDNAFENCTALENLEWKIKNIAPANYGNNVFLNAGSAENGFRVIIYATAESLPGDMVENSNVSEAEINTPLALLPANIFYGCKYLKTVKFPATLETIGESAFYDCDALEYIELPEGLKKISAKAFYDCDGLKELKIPLSLTEIRDQAFAKCDSLQLVDISEAAAGIYMEAFYQCSALTELKLSDSIAYIGQRAFYSCTSLKQICLPDNKCSIGANAFYGCTALIEIIIPGKITTVDFSVFSNSTSLKKLVFYAPDYELKSTNITNISNFTIVAHPGGNIEQFAKEKAFPFDGFHNYSEEIICTATCTEDGESFNKCYYCDEKINVQHTKAFGHNKLVIYGSPASCILSGMTDGEICTVCNEILTEQTKIPALGHKEEILSGKAATCTKKGLSEGAKCAVCNEILDPQAELAATGHTEEIIPGKTATCTKTGLTEGKKCSVCGEILVAQEEIPLINHNYESVTKAPTCTSTGYVITTCTVCGEVFRTDEDIPMLPHTPGEWEVVTESQIGVEGKEQQKCTVCGQVVSEKVLPAIPEVTYIPGDVSGDGRITAADARLILRISAKLDSADAYSLPFAVFDVSKDGKITAADARKVLRIAAKLE